MIIFLNINILLTHDIKPICGKFTFFEIPKSILNHKTYNYENANFILTLEIFHSIPLP